VARARTLYRGTAVHTWLDQYVEWYICGWTDVREVRCVEVVVGQLCVRNDLHIP